MNNQISSKNMWMEKMRWNESISPTALEAIMSPSCKAKSPYVEMYPSGIAKSLLIGHEREGDIILGAKKIGKRIGKYFVSKGYLADLTCESVLDDP